MSLININKNSSLIKQNKGNIIHNEFINMYQSPSNLIDIMDELVNNDNIKATVIKGGRGSGKSTVAIHYVLNLMLTKKYENRKFVFGGWKKEDTKETQDKIKIEIKRLKKEIQSGFIINETKRTIEYIPNNTSITFIPLTDFISGGSKGNNLNRIKAFNNVALWVIDEAIFITKDQLNIMLRTARENYNALKKEYRGEKDLQIESSSKMLFLLNPSNPNGDPVVNYLKTRKDSKVYHVNIDDIPKKYQSKQLIDIKNQDLELVKSGLMQIETYNHIWLGQPEFDLHYQPFRNVKYIDFNIIKDKIINSKFISVLDVSAGGGDNTVLSYGVKILDEYYIIGWSSQLATNDMLWIQLMKEKQEIFKADKIVYEKNGVGGNLNLKKEGLPTISYHQTKNKELKISTCYPLVNKINLLIDSSKENKVWYNNIIDFNPSKSKNDDEVDVLSELIKRL